MQLQGTPQVLESSQFREFQQKDKQNWAGMQGASQTTFLQRPEDLQDRRIGNMHVQTKSNEAQMNQNQRMEAQSQSVQQVGNSQIQRRTRVVEEFERSQTAKTIEIRTNSDGTVTSTVSDGGELQESAPLRKINEDEMPPRGIVASQARRFSQEVVANGSTMSSVASKVQNLNLRAETERQSFFPSTAPAQVEKNRFPVYHADDTARNDAVVFPPPGFGTASHSDVKLQTQRIKEQQQKLSSQISYSARPFSYTAAADLNAITIPSITQFKPLNNNNVNNQQQQQQQKPIESGGHFNSNNSNSNNSNNNQNFNNNPTNQSNLNPSLVVYPPTMNPLAQQQQQQPQSPAAAAPSLPPLTAPLSFSSTSSAAAATNGTSMSVAANKQTNAFKSTSTSATGASVSSFGSANCPSSTTNSNKPNNNNNNKGGAGITLAPKRGRGVMNRAVAPGGRIPLCGCCNSQIRLAEAWKYAVVCLEWSE